MFILVDPRASLNPIALRTAKTPKSFGRSECSRVKMYTSRGSNSALFFFFAAFLSWGQLLKETKNCFLKEYATFLKGFVIMGSKLEDVEIVLLI